MKQKAIQPFTFLSDDQVKSELDALADKRWKDRYVAKNEIIVIKPYKRDYPIQNKENPFINFCKGVAKFISDNVKISISGMPFSKTLKVGDFIPNTEDKIKNIPLPAIKTTITAGPLEIEVDSNDVKSIADCLVKK